MQVVLEDIKRTLGAKEVCLPRYPDKQPTLSEDIYYEALPGPVSQRHVSSPVEPRYETSQIPAAYSHVSGAFVSPRGREQQLQPLKEATDPKVNSHSEAQSKLQEPQNADLEQGKDVDLQQLEYERQIKREERAGEKERNRREKEQDEAREKDCLEEKKRKESLRAMHHTGPFQSPSELGDLTADALGEHGNPRHQSIAKILDHGAQNAHMESAPGGLPKPHKSKKADLDRRQEIYSEELSNPSEPRKAKMAVRQGTKLYRWICCNCGGDNSCSHDAGCHNCSNHWRQGCCTVYVL
jgi:hypothetical protein